MKLIWLTSVALFACGSNEAATMSTTLTSAGITVDVDSATDQITTDRCNRQLSCGNIGKGRAWRDRRACELNVDKETHNVIGRSCSSVDASRLSACLNEIRDQRCEASNHFPLACEGVRLCR